MPPRSFVCFGQKSGCRVVWTLPSSLAAWDVARRQDASPSMHRCHWPLYLARTAAFARAHTAYSSSSSVLHRARLLQTYRRVLQPTVSGNALQQIQLHGELKHSSGRMSCVLLVTRPYGECFNSPSQPWSDLRLACLWGLSAAALLCNYAASLFGLWVLRTLWRCP